jgi:hypothetical protein
MGSPLQQLAGGARWHLLLVAGLLLGACSTTEYGKPINDFAAATNDAATALARLDAQLADSYSAVLEKGILSNTTFVQPKVQGRDKDCLADSARCRLELVDRKTNEVKAYPPQPPLATMSEVMARINKYAANLKALVEADTAKDAEANVNAALGSVQNLAETLAGAEKPVPQFATSAGAAVNWVVGQYVDHVKFAGLQRATATAKPVVRDAANLFAKTSTVAELSPRADFADAVNDAIEPLRTARTRTSSNLAAARQSAARYDAILTTTPNQVFQRMAAAHDALADSLQGEGATLVTALARIEAFGDEAKKLAKILTDLHAATTAKTGG